ncbi:MAG: hypothetical protein KJO36_11890 [Acidimicrobiia bacterium]|nr:hypothetical protein [Acidimicrobiia bacterium]
MRKQRIDIKKIHAAPTLLLIAAAILLVGCRAESRTLVRFDAEGGATVEARVLLDDESAAFVGRQGDTPADVAATLAQSLGSGSAGYQGTSSRLETGDLTGVVIGFEALGPSDISAILTDSNSVLDRVMVTVEGGVLRFEAFAEPAVEDDTRRLVATAPANIRDIVGMVLVLEVPGTVNAHNADRVAGNVLEWDLLPAILDRRAIEPFAEVTVPAGFALSADVGPVGDTSTPSELDRGVDESTPAWVWVVPAIAGLAAWLVLARRAARQHHGGS